MRGSTMTGSRIRARRQVVGRKQAELARAVEISPAYLNLIEHNRRRIGGKLLIAIARELGVEPTRLTGGAEAEKIGLLRAAAARLPGPAAETGRGEEFAGRFPGWSGLVAAQHRRIRELEQLVELLSDRLTHDPHLAASLHDVLTTVTAIHSTVSILTEPGGVEPDWQARFLRNIAEDSARLTSSATDLVRFLEAEAEATVGPGAGPIAPQEELAAFLETDGYLFPALEPGGRGVVDEIVAASPALRSAAAQRQAGEILRRYRADASRLPAKAFATAWDEAAGDPVRVAGALAAPVDQVLRRAAALGPDSGRGRPGLAICDGTGTLTFRKPARGFSLPRFGGACPLWPLYQALVRPGQPLRARVRLPGAEDAVFTCIAISQARFPAGLDGPMVPEATMLILPGAEGGGDGPGGEPVRPVGINCRICPRPDCAARREPSILSSPG